MTKNNLSRIFFNEFVEQNKAIRDSTSRNVFLYGRNKCAFSTITSLEKIECRQFYEDCDFLVAYLPEKEKVYIIHRDNLTMSSSFTRINSKNVKSYNASCSYDIAKKSWQTFKIGATV